MNEFQAYYSQFIEVDDATWWSRLRYWRNEKLKSTDWVMTIDAPTDKQAWTQYRQALRDLPATSVDPKNPQLPIEPEIG